MIPDKHIPQRFNLVNVLWDIQKKRRYISKDDIAKIANEFNISKTELEGIISFYHFFHFKDAGKYTIYLNCSTISKLYNYHEVKKAFEDELGIKMGNTTKDKMFGLFQTSCIGLSDQETSALINYYPFTNLTAEKARTLIAKIRAGHSLQELCNFPKDNIQYKPEDENKTIFFKPFEIGDGLKKLKKLSPEDVIKMVEDSKLSGRGGAFFPTGTKWKYCRNNVSDQKYIICNADEGEPGTFKDRVLLNSYPELLIEGMAIAGYAVGATEGFIYLRAEYKYLKEGIEKAIENFNQAKLLGKVILGIENFDFNVQIFIGAGAYVCGEETALIASMEGKRGEPTTKEYFPVEKGYLGKPTVVNNVETLCAVPRLLEMGLKNYLAIGTKSTPGTKLLSVSGDCTKPGVYEIEWGMKLKDFLVLIGANDPYMILFNGFAGECLSSVDFEREISGENLLADQIQFTFKDPIEYAHKMSGVGLRSGGSFMVFNQSRSLISVLKNITDFFVAESCGICVPCRTGNFLLSRKIDKIKLGHGSKSDMEEIQEWSHIIKQSSRCGLGKTSTNCLLTAMLKFPEEFEKLTKDESDFNDAFNIDRATQNYDNIIQEIESTYD
ncbi:NAD(P)H-dependent oxidoreductase subunit E [Winogradskyella alexanderae]|uniref:NAD(P)H-dependent oxidoreductase subunit E n=1 Tax=Winogradskyella alexanderae TaxID=2877123 RepID=A0ABS7XTZ5_9FLAO|nr:NAD(P)H-dependent oxidoreductase subunit E [Winogradskyella alexanderae]MCA0132281.1 NAD(P)H-dependent oxidoreductase subunit E [Winogradskyella alexanderae]